MGTFNVTSSACLNKPELAGWHGTSGGSAGSAGKTHPPHRAGWHGCGLAGSAWSWTGREGREGREGRARSFSLLSDATKLVLGCCLVVLCFVLGWRVLGTRGPDFKIWPIADDLIRAGSGRLAGVVPGKWEVVCDLVPYGHMRSQVRDGLRQAHLSPKHALGMPEFYMGENGCAPFWASTGSRGSS